MGIDFLLYGWFLETVMITGEFDAMGFDVGCGLCEEIIMGLEAFYEDTIWPKGVRHVHRIERHMQGRS